MSGSRRMRLDHVLGNALPGWVAADEGHGYWHTAAGRFGWELDPADTAFWLLLWNALDLRRAAPGLLGQAGEWPWPLKPARRHPGAELLWFAEIRLDGKPGEAQRIQALVRVIDSWLSRRDDSRPTSPGQFHSRADSCPPSDDEHLIFQALGNSLKRTSDGFRLPSQDGTALLIKPEVESWSLRTTMARGADAMPWHSSACLDDLLAVANSRLRGCRGFLETQGATEAVVLETRLTRDSLTGDSIRATADALSGAARRLAAACQVLVQQPRVGELYEKLLIGEREPTSEAGLKGSFVSESEDSTFFSRKEHADGFLHRSDRFDHPDLGRRLDWPEAGDAQRHLPH